MDPTDDLEPTPYALSPTHRLCLSLVRGVSSRYVRRLGGGGEIAVSLRPPESRLSERARRECALGLRELAGHLSAAAAAERQARGEILRQAENLLGSRLDEAALEALPWEAQKRLEAADLFAGAVREYLRAVAHWSE